MAFGRRILFGLAAAGMMLAAQSPARAQTTVTMWTFLDPAKTSGREVALRRMIENFERANPGIRVRVEPQIFSELISKFLAAHNTGTAPDVVWVNTENMGALARSGAAADLQALFVSRWPAAENQDFFVRAGFDAGVVGERRFAVPLFHATTSIFYRKDLFRAAGIDPASIKTWDQLAEAAKKLTSTPDASGRVNVWGFGTPLSTERTGGTTAFSAMMYAGEGMWEARCRPLYTRPTGLRSLQWHTDMIETHRAMPREVIANHVDDIVDQFTAGRYAMAVMPFARFDNVRSQARWNGEELAILPWPNWTTDKVGPQQVQGWYAALWARSRRLPEAARFLEHMINAESVDLWSEVGGQVPTRLSVWQNPKYRDPKFAFMETVVEAWRAWSFQIPTECTTTQFDADLNRAVQRVVVGRVAPAAAMAEAERAFLGRQ
jgi:multiple sugar transport system substrate-binding protein